MIYLKDAKVLKGEIEDNHEIPFRTADLSIEI
jgi:hypothetical protein